MDERKTNNSGSGTKGGKWHLSFGARPLRSLVSSSLLLTSEPLLSFSSEI